MGESQRFLDSVLRKHNPLSSAMGDLVVSFDSEGRYIWSNPVYNSKKKAICLEFLSDQGKVYYIEASRIFDIARELSGKQADFVWREGVTPWPLVSANEQWERVAWAVLEKHKQEWRKMND